MSSSIEVYNQYWSKDLTIKILSSNGFWEANRQLDNKSIFTILLGLPSTE